MGWSSIGKELLKTCVHLSYGQALRQQCALFGVAKTCFKKGSNVAEARRDGAGIRFLSQAPDSISKRMEHSRKSISQRWWVLMKNRPALAFLWFIK
jgi:hypothetical protein